jgi:6-phospho-3-hexuloisomerase
MIGGKMDTFAEAYKNTSRQVIGELQKTLDSIDPASLEKLTEAILDADQVFFVGVGRVLLSLQSVAKRLAHLGIQAHYVGEITEPAITPKDLLIVGSGSGASLFPLGIAKKAKGIGCRIVHIGSNPNSEMKDIADFMVRIPVRTKFYLQDEIDSVQPMTSLFEQSVLLVGDIIAKMIIDQKQLDMKALWQYHANLE